MTMGKWSVIFSGSKWTKEASNRLTNGNARDPVVRPSFSPLAYINHPFQPTGSFHFSGVFFIYSYVYQSQQSAGSPLLTPATASDPENPARKGTQVEEACTFHVVSAFMHLNSESELRASAPG